MAEHRPDGAVDVADGELAFDGGAVGDRVPGDGDELVVQGLLEAVVLRDEVSLARAVGALDGGEDRREVEAARLPVRDGLGRVEVADLADRLREGAEPERREVLADLLGDVLEERLDELRLAGEAGAQLGVLGRDADRAGVEVADPHEDAPADDERCRGEAELLGAEQRGDDDVAPGLDLPVHLDDDPVAKTVEDEGLLGLGEPELPRTAGVLEARQRRGAGAAVVPRDEDDVGVRLAHARRDRADADLGDELDVDPGLRVGVLEVVDELGEILDRVDVVVRRRRDEPDARRRVPGLGDPRVDLADRAADRPRRAWRPGPS